jgi:hypothetical protein
LNGIVSFERTSKAWHPLPGAPLRFRLRFVATLRLRLKAGSGLLSAGLFALTDYSTDGSLLTFSGSIYNTRDIESMFGGDCLLK